MLDNVVDVLACPLCGASLVMRAAELRCTRGHSFDIARQGYASLLAGDAKLGTADTAAMIGARERFLSQGHFSPIAEEVAELAVRLLGEAGPAGPIVEIGAGTGYYLSRALDASPDRLGVAIDISKYAGRRAARTDQRMAAVVADIWRGLPLQASSVALVLDVFAPRNAVEIARVLRPEGALLVVTPTTRHLHEIVGALGLVTVDESKGARLEAALADDFARSELRRLEYSITLAPSAVADFISMGPSARHLGEGTIAQTLEMLPPSTEATVSVEISTYLPVRREA